MSSILIIDDEKAIRKTLSEILGYEGYKIDEASDGEEGLSKFKSKTYDLVLCDIKMPKLDGIEFLEKAKEINSEVPIIIISGHGNIETAVEAVKKGAYDYISKPPDLNRMLITLRNAMDKNTLVAETKVLKRRVNKVQEIVGESRPIREIKNTIDKIAPTEARVLITGENGVGKELVARWIHQKSARCSGSLVEVNCAAIPGELIESELFGHEKGSFTSAVKQRIGKFEQASGGTLFLDEIGNISLQQQAKLLSVLQNRQVIRLGTNQPIPVDIRLICATNMPLQELANENRFRKDLIYRINTVEITLPPLRSRKEDILLLAKHFAKQYAAKYRKPSIELDKSALEKLMKYPFPGNVRELQYTMERAIIMSDDEVLGEKDLLFSPIESSVAQTNEHDDYKLSTIEKNTILRVIEKHNGNITKAARELGLTRTALYRRLSKYDI